MSQHYLNPLPLHPHLVVCPTSWTLWLVSRYPLIVDFFYLYTLTWSGCDQPIIRPGITPRARGSGWKTETTVVEVTLIDMENTHTHTHTQATTLKYARVCAARRKGIPSLWAAAHGVIPQFHKYASHGSERFYHNAGTPERKAGKHKSCTCNKNRNLDWIPARSLDP